LLRPASERTIANARRILFVITGLELGGAEVQLWRLCQELSSRGWSLRVVSLIPPGTVGNWLRESGIEVGTLEMTRGIASPAAIGRLVREMEEFGPELVHSHMFHANLLARIACLLRTGTPLVNSSHVEERGLRAQHLAYRLTARACVRFHCVSRRALERLAGSRAVAAERLVYIPNGVPEPTVAADSRERLRDQLEIGAGFVYLCAGRLHPDKDPGNLVDAFARVSAEDPRSRLLIAGDGPLEREIRAQIARLGIESQVRVLGARSDLPELMRCSDALVIPSRSEALPLVLLEAALARLPVVATAVGDIPEVVEDGRSGLLCRPQDGASLATRMLEIRGLQPERRRQLAEVLHERVSREYALERVVSRWEDLYAEVLARP